VKLIPAFAVASSNRIGDFSLEFDCAPAEEAAEGALVTCAAASDAVLNKRKSVR